MITAMLLPHSFAFEKFRRELSSAARSDLDRIAARLARTVLPRLHGGNTLDSFTRVIAFAAPALKAEECRALAVYSLRAILTVAVGQSTQDQMTQGQGTQDLMSATQQMQETQMSFNMQYLMLQENVQNDGLQYTCLSNVMKARFDTMKGILANIR